MRRRPPVALVTSAFLPALWAREARRAGSPGPLQKAWRLVTVAVMLLLALVGGLSFLALLNNATRHLDRYLVALLEKQLHRPVRIGSVSVQQPGRIRLTGLEVAAGPTFAEGVMLRAPEVVAQYRIWDLVRGRVDPVGSISRVLIRDPYALIIRDRTNHFNIQALFPKRKRPPRPSPFRGLVQLEGGTIRFVDYAVRDLPAPQTNVLSGISAVLDAGAPPLMVVSASAPGDGARIGRIAGEGTIQPDRGGYAFHITTESEDASYWSRYFVRLSSIRLDAGRGTVALDLWKPRQKEPISLVVRVDAHDGAARTAYTRAPVVGVRGTVTLRTGRPLETVLDLSGSSAGVPVRVTGSVFTGKDARLALRASASGVTLASLRRIVPRVPSLSWAAPLAPATVQAEIYGPLSSFLTVADVQVPRAKLYNTFVSNVSARVRYQDGILYIPTVNGTASGQPVNATGTINMRTRALDLVANVPGVNARALGLTRLPLTGTVASRIVVTGTTTAPRSSVLVTVRNGRFRNVPFERMAARLSVTGQTVNVEDAVAIVPGGTLLARGSVRLDGPIAMRVSASGVRLGRLLPAAGYQDISGTAFFQGTVTGSLSRPVVEGQARLYNARVRGQQVDYAVGQVTATPDRVRLTDVSIARYPAQGTLSGTARLLSNGQVALDMVARLQTGRLETLLQDAGFGKIAEGRISTDGDVRIGGTLATPDIRGTVLVSDASVHPAPGGGAASVLGSYPIESARATFRFHGGNIDLTDVEASTRPDTFGQTIVRLPRLLVRGERIEAPERFTIQNFVLSRFQGLGAPYVRLAGVVDVSNGHIGGTRSDPTVSATIRVPQLTVNQETFTDVAFGIAYRRNEFEVNSLTVQHAGRELLSVPRAAWSARTRTATAQVRASAFPISLLLRLVRESDWYFSPEGRSLGERLRTLASRGMNLETATLTLAGGLVTGEPVNGSNATQTSIPDQTVAAAEPSPGALAPTEAPAPVPPSSVTPRGALDITSAPTGISLVGAVMLRDLGLPEQNLTRLSVTGELRNLHEAKGEPGHWIASVHVPENGFRAESRDMDVGGQLTGTSGGNLTAEIDAKTIPLAWARVFAPAQYESTPIGGTLTVQLNAWGLWDKPDMQASVSGQDIRFGTATVPLVIRSSTINVKNEPQGTVIQINRNISILAKDHSLRISGYAPFDWATKRIPRNQPIDLVADVDEQGFDLVSILLAGAKGAPVQTAKGSIKAHVGLKGTLAQQNLEGYVHVQDGTLKVPSLRTTFQNINIDASLDPSKDAIVFDQMTMESSSGGKLTVAKQSAIAWPNIGTEGSRLEPDVAINLEGFRLEEVPNALGLGERIKGTLSTSANAPVRIVRDDRRPNGFLVRGAITLSDVEVVPPTQAPAPSSGGQPPAVVPSFDLNLVVGKNVWVRNPLFRVHLDDRGSVADRSLRVTNTLLQPRVFGTLTSHDGTLIYPTARFRLTDAVIRVHYPPVENVAGATPDLLLTSEESSFTISANAQARLVSTVSGRRQPVTVYMHVEGPNPGMAASTEESAFGSLSPYRITLRSTPSLPERQLVALITREAALQQLAEGADPQTVLRQETMNILQASVLPEALSGFETRLGEAFGLEYLSLDYTMINNTLSVTATKRVTNRLSLTYSRPIGDNTTENAYSIGLSYEIRPRLQLTLQQQRGPYITGIHQPSVPGPQSTVTETSILLEGSWPF